MAIMPDELFQVLGAQELLVYVKPLSLAETEELRKEVSVVPEGTCYAVYRADGFRLAVLSDREAAFAGAHAHDMKPVLVN